MRCVSCVTVFAPRIIDKLGYPSQFADEEWQRLQFGGVEGYWGLFHDKYVSPFFG